MGGSILNFFKQIWDFFTSVKLSVTLLLSLAATSIIGTLIPQNESPENYHQAFGDFFYRLFDVLDLYDMYHAWWFRLLLVLLTINILVCSAERLSATWKVLFPRRPVFNPARFRKADNRRDFSVPAPPADLQPRFEAVVAGGFGYRRTEEDENGFRLLIEKWRRARLGVYVVHLSVLLLILGGLIGSIYGFEGFVNIAEGESTEAIHLRNSRQGLKLPFAIRCDDFEVSFYENKMPKEFRSDLVIVENGSEVLKKSIIVNDPLRYRGINIFQSSYGELPPLAGAGGEPPDEVTLTFTARDSGLTYEARAAIGTAVEIPEAMGTFILERYLPAADFRGQNIGEALAGTFSPADGKPVQILLPLHFPNFDRMRGGQVVIAVAGFKSQSFTPGRPPGGEQRWFTGLQVTYDPGVGVVYTGFVLMLVGCFITFFMSHQQIVIEVQARKGGSWVRVAGHATRYQPTLDRRVERISEQLRQAAEG